jgi:hypothetical protein
MSYILPKFNFLILLVISITIADTHVQKVFSQTGGDISITVANSSFARMTNVNGNQAKVSVTYELNDESLDDKKINGIMSIYSPNGTLIRHSSFSDGFEAKKDGGTVDFKTTIRDPGVKELVANVTLTDLSKEKVLSNSVSINLTLIGSTESEISNQDSTDEVGAAENKQVEDEDD